jgi:polysaccharide chain length determinant protein (PEP-CTERM system associated)
MNLAFYGRILLRRLPVMLVLVTICTVGAVLWALSLPTSYRAEARLIVETEQIPGEMAASTVQTAATEQIQIIEQRLMTRQVLLELANRQNIYAGEEELMPASDKVADLKDRIRISVNRGGRGPQATLVTVSFDGPDARQAALVTNDLVTLILQENAALRQAASSETLEFFVQEVERLSLAVSAVNARILSFQEENLDSLPDSLDFRRAQQAAAQERRLQIDRNIAQLHERRASLVELFENGGQVPQDDSQRALSSEERQLATLRDEYANLSVILSADNPRLTLLNARIEALEERVLEQQSSRLAGAEDEEAAEPLSPFDIQLADIDSQLASLERQRADVDARLTALEGTIRATPGNAVALSALEREYNNLREQYNQAVNNRALAETGELIESLSKGQRISVIEPATPPTRPQSPNRPLIAIAGLSGGLALAAGFFLLLELLTRTVRQPAEITNRLGITALSTIPYIQTSAQQRLQRVAFASLVVVLVAIMGSAIWLVGFGDVALDMMIDDVLDRARALTASL